MELHLNGAFQATLLGNNIDSQVAGFTYHFHGIPLPLYQPTHIMLKSIRVHDIDVGEPKIPATVATAYGVAPVLFLAIHTQFHGITQTPENDEPLITIGTY